MVLLAEAFDGHMRAIGIITVRWSSVDRNMYDILRDRLNLKQAATKLRSQHAGTGRLCFFKARIEHSNVVPKEKNDLIGAVDCLRELYKDRNMIVHGQYGIIAEKDGSISVSYSDIGTRKGEELSDGRLDPAAVTVDHLVQHATDVYEAAKPLVSFLYRRPESGSD